MPPEQAPSAPTPPRSAERERTLAGLANVAAMTFLAARAVPGGFVVALAGGVPLARAAQRHGTRAGYAAAGASLIETMAVMGPARMGIPVPHAASAPALGALERRGAALLALALTGAAIRFAYYIATSAFYILVLVGLDAYSGTYEAVRQTLTVLPAGDAAAILFTAAFLALWSLAAGLIQAWVLRRGLRRWPDAERQPGERPAAAPERRGLADSRAVVGAGLVAIAITLATTEPVALALVAAWLLAAWLLVRAGARSFAGGLALAAPLALSTLAFGLVGGLGGEVALRRAARVALLVLTAVWLRSAAGAAGLRAISLRAVRRLRRLPTLALSARVLGASAGVGDYGDSARRLGRRMRSARKRPAALLGAALGWIAAEAGRLPQAAEETAGGWSATETALIAAAATLATLAAVALVA
ncbi:MAG TPA: hypothetical protein VGV36_01045 [Solirubrobacteraceae bacterium]|nr:hypothetical protein [Solirubrobacteraceae bacterium]